MKHSFLRSAACLALLAASAAFAANDSIVTAVFSKVSNGYHRKKLPDGSFKREFYALTNGTYNPGLSRDRSIDAVRYPQVAKLVAQFLATQNYYLAQDAKSADILLMITWGKTIPFNDSVYRTNMDSFFSSANTLAMANAAAAGSAMSMEGIQSPAASVAAAARSEFTGQLFQLVTFEDMRRKANEHNARLLGYVDDINNRDTPARFAGAGDAFDELNSDIEDERYYVIVAAYDFRAAARGEPRKLLWTTRVSIQAQGNRFNERLAVMLSRAASHFGQDTPRLIRQYEPEAKVTIGDLKFVGFVSDAEAEAKPAESKQH